jgi:hypothetical protein
VSNAKQFALAMLMYVQDYDETMMPASQDTWCIGPGAAALGGVPQRGPQVFLNSYTKNQDIYKCPDEGAIGNNGLPGTDATGATNNPINVPLSMTYSQAYGHSYKFTKENFSIIPLNGDATNYPSCYGGILLKPKKDYLVAIAATGSTDSAGNPTFTTSGSGTPPPSQMTLSFFAQPSRTIFFHCQNPGWGGATAPTGQSIWHQAGETFAFLDGHAHFETRVDKPKNPTNPYQLDRFCDGATGAPPIGSTDTCNVAGEVRINP